MAVIHAVYENGVFRPTERVDLPESSEVELELRRVRPASEDRGLDAIYALLGARFEFGEADVEQDRTARAELERKLLEPMGGEAREMCAEDWEKLRAEVRLRGTSS